MNATVTDLKPIEDYQTLSDRDLSKEIDWLDRVQMCIPRAEYQRRKAICGKLLDNRRDERGVQQFQALIAWRQREIARLMEVVK